MKKIIKYSKSYNNIISIKKGFYDDNKQNLKNSIKTISEDDTKVSEMESLVEITDYIKNTFHNPIRELLYPTEVLAKKVEIQTA